MIGTYTLSPNLAFDVHASDPLHSSPWYRVSWYSLSEGADLGSIILCESDLHTLLAGAVPVLLEQ